MSSEDPCHDLAIGRRLADGSASAADITAFAQWPLARRAPYLDAVFARVADEDPIVRAAVVSALRGVRGVPGVRAIVAGLSAQETRNAARFALMHTARDAPMRWVHALFHGDVEVRRAAVPDTPHGAMEMLAYLRADPACAVLVDEAGWPDAALPLAFDLHANGHIDDVALVRVIASRASAELRGFFETERGRLETDVEAYLEQKTPELVGVDVIDQAFAAIEGAGVDRSGTIVDPDHPTRWALRALTASMEAVVTKKPGPLTRRAAASLLARIAGGSGSMSLIGACCALEPRVIEAPVFDARYAPAAVDGLIRWKWPVRISKQEVARLLALAIMRVDLALAAAVVGLASGARLKLLAKILGEDSIIEALLASDHGWDVLCQLPQETPALELAWLARIEAVRIDRYLALVAGAMLAFGGKRLEHLIDQIPRRHRERAFLAVVERTPALDVRFTTVCRTMASRLDRTALIATFGALLGDPTDRGPLVALVLARALEAKLLVAVGKALADDAVLRFVGVLDGPEPLPRDRELALATAFADRKHVVVAEWSRKMSALPPVPAAAIAAPAVRPRRALDEREKDRIATCAEGSLDVALEPALSSVVTGLTEALAKRGPCVSIHACAALLGCADPMDHVARQLDRFCDTSRAFDNELDSLVGATFHRIQGDTSPFLHARMYRWEAHDYALARWMERMPTVSALEIADALPGRFAAKTLWTGIAEVIVFLRYRDPERFKKLADEKLALYVAERVDRDIGAHAARILVALVETNVVPAALVKNIVLDRAADADALTREFLVRVARLEGMPEPPKIDHTPPPPELLDQVRACTDPDALLAFCAHTRRTIVQEAALQLLLLGEQGQLLLAGLLARLAELPAPVPVLASIALWDSEAALARARALAGETTLAPEWRYHLCMGLVARGDADLIDGAFAAVRAPAAAWFRRVDWDKLVELVGEDRCALELADSPHHHAYQPAVRALIESWDTTPAIRDALVRFLEADAERPLMLRRDVARRLIKEYSSFAGLPILVDEICDDKTDEGFKFIDVPLTARLAEIARVVIGAALIGGDSACSEKRAWDVLQKIAGLATPAITDAIAPLYARILEEASHPYARRAAAPFVVTQIDANARLREVAEVFAWGVRRGVELTRRVFRIHMTSDESDFGHTFLEQSKLYVSPLAMLKDEMHGRDIVEGLVLHEIGHHIYHRNANDIWAKARGEGLHRFLNLVADEHLERNLRAIDPAYGDRLKRLGAYAFQHAAQEINVRFLLESLRGSAAPALIATPLEVAFREDSVKARRGAVLAELDRTGHPVARFARALRLGQGNRHDDPRVAAALALCKDIRKLDMAGLYELTRRLAAIFGGAVAVSRAFGGPEDLGDGGERDRDVFAAGIDDDVLQREVERILEPKKGRADKRHGRDRLQINVNPDEHFERISSVQRVRGVPEMHNRIANTISRHSTRLRAHLDDLGLRWERAHARIQGHTLDRARLRALVTRNDPRILIARRPVRRTDLFLGTLIDCSSSMTAGDNIERARQFAVLITEAVRPLPGVEARFFGFTDSIIYDAGDANDCGVTGLVAEGGNNDAAGLFHAANVAAASNKRAKVLVMISDGLPTSCSVAALRGLVTNLTRRRGMVCAQVAVRELEEVCFPHYVVLDDDQLDVAVARFGRMIADLTRRALGA